jgi:hypothetical protein
LARAGSCEHFHNKDSEERPGPGGPANFLSVTETALKRGTQREEGKELVVLERPDRGSPQASQAGLLSPVLIEALTELAQVEDLPLGARRAAPKRGTWSSPGSTGTIMTIGTAQVKAHIAAMIEVQTFMHKCGLTFADLIDVGGAELKSSNPKTREKAHRVERCWALMARLHVRYAHLETAYTPTKPIRRRRGEGGFLQAAENTGVSGITATPPESNEINELAGSAPVASLDSKTGPAL